MIVAGGALISNKPVIPTERSERTDNAFAFLMKTSCSSLFIPGKDLYRLL